MEQNYEMVMVSSPDQNEADRQELIKEIQKTIEADKGKIIGIDEWGKRELSYPINKNSQGYYFVISFKGSAATPQKLTAKLRLAENLLRHLIVKQEGDKKEEKVKIIA
ncbi:MAG: 30S ribosomal protein S6 [bacterium]|nr:30S ribosomal protein S6 [bacterium]